MIESNKLEQAGKEGESPLNFESQFKKEFQFDQQEQFIEGIKRHRIQGGVINKESDEIEKLDLIFFLERCGFDLTNGQQKFLDELEDRAIGIYHTNKSSTTKKRKRYSYKHYLNLRRPTMNPSRKADLVEIVGNYTPPDEQNSLNDQYTDKLIEKALSETDSSSKNNRNSKNVNVSYWHTTGNPDQKAKDRKKRLICNDKNILLIEIWENWDKSIWNNKIFAQIEEQTGIKFTEEQFSELSKYLGEI